MNPSTQAGLFAALAILIIAALAAPRRAGRARPAFILLCLALLLSNLGYVLLRLTGSWGELSLLGGLLFPLAALMLTAALLGIGGLRLKWGLRAALIAVALIGLSHLLRPLDVLGQAIATLERYYTSAWLIGRAIYLLGPALLVLAMLAGRALTEPAALVRRQLWSAFGAGALAWGLHAAALLSGTESWRSLATLSQVLLLYVLYLALIERSRLSLAELAAKLAAFAASTLVLALVFGILVYWVGNEPQRFVSSILAAGFLVLLLYEPLVGRIAAGLSGLFLRDRLEMGRMLGRLQSATVTLTEPQQLERFACAELARGVGAGRAALYRLSEAGALEPGPDDAALAAVTELLDPLRTTRAPLSSSSLGQAIYEALGQGDQQQRVKLEAARRALEQLKFEVAVPLAARGRMLAVWLLSPERAGAYGAEEVAVLGALGDQLGLKLDSLLVLAELRQRERLAALGEMAAGLAHELKNPLGSLSGAARMIDPAALPAEQRNWLRIVIEDTARLGRVLERFLEFARPAPLRRERCAALPLARRTCELLRPDPALARVALSCVAPDGDPGELYADPDQLGQVLINLILNAAQAAADRPVNVAVRVLRAARGGRPGMLFEVRDNGPGIDPSDRGRIFTPFFTKRPGGTGLGLATSKRIVEAHDGAIEAVDPDGPGALLRVWLPADAESNASREEPSVEH